MTPTTRPWRTGPTTRFRPEQITGFRPEQITGFRPGQITAPAGVAPGSVGSGTSGLPGGVSVLRPIIAPVRAGGEVS